MKITKVKPGSGNGLFYFDVQYVPEFSKEDFQRLFDEFLQMPAYQKSHPAFKNDYKEGQARIYGESSVWDIYGELWERYPIIEKVEEFLGAPPQSRRE